MRPYSCVATRSTGPTEFVLVLLCVFGGVAACAQRSAEPAKPPMVEPRADRPEEEGAPSLTPEHVAPPPGYGNKVVMASSRRVPAGL
jgi:hypothetical protein